MKLVANVVLLTAMASVATAQSARPRVPQAEANKLREQFTLVLSGDAKNAKLIGATAKTLAAKYEHGSLLEALREGPLLPKGEPKPRGKGKDAEKFEVFDGVTTGFTFRVGDAVHRYAVHAPANYSPTKPAPLVLDPGHGVGAKEDQKGKADYLGYFRHRADAAGLENALIVRTEIIEQIGADGLAGKRPEDQVCAVFDACFKDLASRYAIDLDRVWVTGLSQTGFWSWQLGLTRPDRFAGIAPMGAVTWSTKEYLPNLAQLAIWVLHGDADKTCPVAQPRQTTKALAELGARVEYREIAGGAHDYSTWQHLDEGLRWLAERPRDPFPKTFTRHLQTLEQPWCYWVRVDELERVGSGEAGKAPSAKLSAKVDGQTIEITSEGVKRITVGLSSELVDLTKPVKLVWNGAEKFERVLERDFALTVDCALKKCDWRGLLEGFVELKR